MLSGRVVFFEKQAPIAIAKKSKVMLECVVIYPSPVLAGDCRYQEQQRRAGLVEIGD